MALLVEVEFSLWGVELCDDSLLEGVPLPFLGGGGMAGITGRLVLFCSAEGLLEALAPWELLAPAALEELASTLTGRGRRTGRGGGRRCSSPFGTCLFAELCGLAVAFELLVVFLG